MTPTADPRKALSPHSWRGWRLELCEVRGGWIASHPLGESAGTFRTAILARQWVDKRLAGGPPQSNMRLPGI